MNHPATYHPNSPLTRPQAHRAKGLLGLILAGGLALAAQELPAPIPPTPPPATGFDAFKLVTDRNIFNPNRSARSDRREVREAQPRRVQTDTISLLGTMIYEQGQFAYFDGSSSQYRKALKPADSIGGCKITRIAPNLVQLEIDGQPLELRVGMQLRREDGGPWDLVAQPEPFARTSTPTTEAGSASTAAAGKPATGPSTGSDESEILRRLMQKREQELNR